MSSPTVFRAHPPCALPAGGHALKLSLRREAVEAVQNPSDAHEMVDALCGYAWRDGAGHCYPPLGAEEAALLVAQVRRNGDSGQTFLHRRSPGPLTPKMRDVLEWLGWTPVDCARCKAMGRTALVCMAGGRPT